MVSVIVTCYNEGHFILEALTSIENQTCYDKVSEIIIVDDGSTDNTSETLKPYLQRNSKAKYIHQENQGLAVARNTGIAAVTEEVILFLDADDVWLESKLEKQLAVLEEYPDVGIVYSDSTAWKKDSRRRLYARRYTYNDGLVLEEFFVKDAPIVPSTTLVRKECFDTVGVFDKELRKAQDTEMWLRIIGRFRIHHVNESLILRRFHDSSLSADYKKKRTFMLLVIEKAIAYYPQLEPLKSKRLIMLDRQMAKDRYIKGQRWQAIKYLVPTIFKEPTQFKSYLVLLLYILPIPYSWIKTSSRFTKF